MAALITLKRRIKTAKNVSKTTKAMQLISASKLKRAQDAALSSKPYVEKLDELSRRLSKRVEKENISVYMKKPENTDLKLIIVVSPDKGLSGGLVTNLVRQVLSLNGRSKNFYITVGKKAEVYLSAFNKEIVASFPFGSTIPSYAAVFPLVKIIDEYFLQKRVSEVLVITTKFVTVFTQIPQASIILPITLSEESEEERDMLFEPSSQELLPDLLKHYLEMSLYQSLLESYASEQAARMIAMKNATDNANEIIEQLQLLYNKTRQEKITNELLDIGGGFTSYGQK